MTVLLVGAGGVIGVMSRYALAMTVSHDTLPWVTVAINVAQLECPRHQTDERREPWWSIAISAATSSEDLELLREQVRATRRLVALEEADLAARIALGDPEAKQQLVEANLHLVTSIADEYHTHDPPLVDLIKAGTPELVRAAETFDPRAGLRFSSHATHQIRQAIVEALSDHGG